MNTSADILQQKFSELLQWERRKRRERVLAVALFYSLLTALLVAPFDAQLALRAFRWLVPFVLFAAGVPLFLMRTKWRRADSVRALARLDKRLRLDERALTAWEALERDQARGPALLVLKQAAEKVASVDPKRLFRRRWGWKAYALAPLFILWFAVVWLDLSVQPAAGSRTSPALARRLDEFARALHERAVSERLPETLRLSRELAELARKGLQSETDDEKLRAEIAGVLQKIDPVAKRALVHANAAESRQNLNDLQAELEAARDLFNTVPGDSNRRGLTEHWLERMQTLPRLKRHFEDAGPSATMGESELKRVLAQLQKQVTGELDRRALLEAQQFLDEMSGRRGEQPSQSSGAAAGKDKEDGRREHGGPSDDSDGSMPGDSAGNQSGSPSLPEFSPGAATQLHGSLGAGQSSGIQLKGNPSAANSVVLEKDVLASYRRQAEADLNSERVPEGLKDTIKKYFMSLDDEERTATQGGQETRKRLEYGAME